LAVGRETRVCIEVNGSVGESDLGRRDRERGYLGEDEPALIDD